MQRASKIALFLWFELAAAAQPITIRGFVADENGVPVSAVELSWNMGGLTSSVANTDEAGRFEAMLPAAGEYLVSLSKPGYFRIADRRVLVNDTGTEVSFTLSHEFEVHETAEVRSPTRQVEPSQIEHQEVLDAQAILNIPVHSSHDLASYLPAISGVVPDNSGGIHVAGGRPEQTEYLLDGFEIGDPATGSLSSRVNVDSFREVNVSSGRYGSEYAHAGAGAMELNTYVGDDRWRFGTTDFIPSIGLQQGLHLGNWYPRFNASGPLAKGRAWFSESVSLQHTFTLIRELPRGANTGQQWAGDSLLRLQVNLTRTNILQGNFLYNLEADSHVGLGAFSPLSTTSGVHARRAFLSAKDQFFFGRHILEFGAAADQGVRDSTPLGSQPYVLLPLSAEGNYFEALHQRNHRVQGLASLTLSSLHWHGEHTIKAGLNADGLAFAQTAFRTSIETLRSEDAPLLITGFFGPAAFRVTNSQAGFYLQDSWKVAKPLYLEIGGRGDWESLARSTLLQPRVGLNFLPFSDDRAKLSIGWGVYYQPIALSLAGQGLDQGSSNALFDSTGGIAETGTTRFSLPAAPLRLPRFHTTSAEWSQKAGSSTFAGAGFAYRVEGDGLAFQDIEPQPLGGLYLLENIRRDRYKSAEVWTRHVFRNRAEVYASFTRSRAQTNTALDYSLLTPFFAQQAAGPLPWDAPNRFISWGWSPLPVWALLLSYHFEYRTGFPFNAVDQEGQLQGAPDQQRFPAFVSLDFGLEKRFPFRGYVWALRIDMINATNHPNPNEVDTRVTPFVFAGGVGRAFTARIRLVGRK